MNNEVKSIKRSWFNNTILFLATLIVFVFILSAIGSLLKWDGNYLTLNPITGVLENNLVSVESLFSREGIRFIIGNAVSNFMNFAPLIMFLFIMIGIGFAERTGLFNSMFGLTAKKISRFWLTFIVVFVSMIFNVIGDIGFMVIIPLSAIMFLINGRNPLIGIISSFVAMTAGYGINVISTQMDFLLTQSTVIGANVIDKSYLVSNNGNLFFGIVCTILLSFIISYITEKVIVKRVGKYKKEDLTEELTINKKEKKGLLASLIAFIVLLIIFIYILLPLGTPLSGILLDYEYVDFYSRVFSNNSYVIQGLSFMLFVTLLVCGWLYGIFARTIKTKNQFSNYLYGSLNNIGGVLVLFFIVSQLIALFKKSNLGTVFTSWIAETLSNLNFSAMPLILLFFLLVALVNIVQTSAASKWAILAPVVVPLFMKSNISPEFTQAIFRAGDSITNVITPFFPYFVVFIGMIQLYNKNEEMIGIKDIYKLLLPYLLVIFFFWIIIFICWYIINLPIGINVLPII